MNRLQQGISVVISAWKAEDFIEECLDSILRQKQWDFNKLEVVLGVDGCCETMQKLEEIQGKYTQLNLRVYWFKENTGVYITTNTLITLAKFNNILTFGADDYMLDYMVFKIMSEDQRYNMVQFGLANFRGEDIIETKLSEGCRFFTKELFMSVGGYIPWRHTGDSEFVARTKPVVKQSKVRETLFMRRIHDGALTQVAETKIGSENRQKYKKLSTENFENGIIIIPMVVNNNYELRLVKEYRENPLEIVQNFARDNQVSEYYQAISDCRSITNCFYENHKTIITYTSVVFNHKELPVINKYYHIVKRITVNHKELTLWKRLK